ncbi:hypothetical protein G6F50_014663 [Rhizopus delemar]|uniref:Uncharacterized protein n=1 Tax=Rhizopus delemar TaxID=936053 RepID=A0A9P6Y3A9_9FUNG|nr:hypothetical protein G6F50_014663 [Rhizopus delemar]
MPLGIQLGHAGRKASVRRPWDGGGQLPADDARGWATVAPSPLPSHRPALAARPCWPLQPFAAGAAVGGRADLVAVQALRQRPRRAVTGTLVLGDPAGPGHPSAAGCVHRLRHPAVVAVAAAPDDGLQRLHHRPGLYRVAAAGLCAGLVRLRAAVGGQGAGRGPAGQQRLPGLGPDGQGAG